MDDKKIKKLLTKYTQVIEELKKANVIRSGKVVADYGEYVASKKLNLKLAESPVNKGYDALDKKGIKYEIKTRKATSWNTPNIFPVKQQQLSVIDFLIYVEFDNEWNLVKMLKIPSKKLERLINIHNRVVVSQELVRTFNILKENKSIKN